MTTHESTNQLTRSWQARAVLAATMVASALVASFAVITTSQAAFTDTTAVGPNSIATGSVILSDDSSGSLMYEITDAVPGVIGGGPKCINVTYTGSLDAAVRLHGSVANTGGGGNNLAPFLDLDVSIGNSAVGGSTFDCTDFVETAALFSNTLTYFGANHDSFTNGLQGWESVSTNDTRSYRIEIELQDDNDAQNKNAQVTFTWEAQGT